MGSRSGPTSSLKEYDFGFSYGARNDLVNEFYVPALSRAIRYDRSAGFFSSSALAVAAAGVARLIENGGRMRLLVGAQLSEDDVRALRGDTDLAAIVSARMLGSLAEATDAIVRDRLAALAWMVREGTLEIRVVLPVGGDGKPLPASITREYYHPKSGRFEDAAGNVVAFSGSVNESEQAWAHNYEQIMVYCSWRSGHGAFLDAVERHFEELWNGSLGDWIAMDIPRAVREKLLRLTPASRPTRDPREEPVPVLSPTTLDDERVLFQFLRDAPFMPNAEALGETSAAVALWPHQRRVVDAVVAKYPQRFLLCDEVGLGKTLEAGAILKRLVLTGRARRALILAPHSVCRQWQEELYEKFVLNVLLYDGDRFTDYHRNVFSAGEGNPWNEYPLILASSQLAKRRERCRGLLEAEPWDVVLVDEAHHARRKDFLSRLYRRNRLLSLLLGEQGEAGSGGLSARTNGLVLLTATPMQIDPREVWDLLTVLGLGGRWGASDADFVRYFEELRKGRDANWPFVMAMFRDYLANGGAISDSFAAAAEEKIGLVGWEAIRSLPTSHKTDSVVRRMGEGQLAVLIEFARRHTPLAQYAFRNTRALLREYQGRGLLGDNKVPTRKPESMWVEMRSDEAALYARIEEYISDFYRKYEAERKGLGFIMTVYRRRLTSSFHAIRCSLERRLEFLRGHTRDLGLTNEDVEDADLTWDVLDEGELDAVPALLREETGYVEDFISELRRLGGDSKVEQLLADLQRLLSLRETILVFTLYTDTMDYLRDSLREIYGTQVACYSGRGGEVWDGTAWRVVPKEEIKKAFREERIKILIGTEAMSEGLNLQTCGMLVNYDMPWNPMRVEQRIGRIDRIGQRYDEVWIHNYFYQDTVEARVYQALEGRIQWFEAVVGELQPILTRVELIIRTAALLAGESREQALARALQDLKDEIGRRELALFNLDEAASEAELRAERVEPPVSLADIEAAVRGNPRFQGLFSPHRDLIGAYVFRPGGEEVAVTFDPELLDQFPDSLRLLTYGDSLLETLFREVPEPAVMPAGILRLADQGTGLRAWYVAEGPKGARLIASLDDLRAIATAGPTQAHKACIAAAEADFETRTEKIRQRLESTAESLRKAEGTRTIEQLRDLLRQAACVEIARHSEGALFTREVPEFQFGDEEMARLKQTGYPYAPAILIAGVPDLSATDPYLLEVMGLSATLCERERARIHRRIEELLPVAASAARALEAAAGTGGETKPNTAGKGTRPR